MDNFRAFCEKLTELLAGSLPGTNAQRRMAPSHRARYPESRMNVREGAVMILLFPSTDGPSTLFTVRRQDLADHAGQISFPGGKREEGESFVETAMRECEEEVGIPKSEVEVLGALSTLYIPPTRFEVHPFVGVLRELPPIMHDEREVEAVLEVPIARLRDPATQESEEWTIRGTKSTVPFFRVDGHVIWGATAMITAELLELIDQCAESDA